MTLIFAKKSFSLISNQNTIGQNIDGCDLLTREVDLLTYSPSTWRRTLIKNSCVEFAVCEVQNVLPAKCKKTSHVNVRVTIEWAHGFVIVSNSLWRRKQRSYARRMFAVIEDLYERFATSEKLCAGRSTYVSVKSRSRKMMMETPWMGAWPMIAITLLAVTTNSHRAPIHYSFWLLQKLCTNFLFIPGFSVKH